MNEMMIECPCCSSMVKAVDHPGLVTNRKAFLRSQLLTLVEQRDRAMAAARTLVRRSEEARHALPILERAVHDAIEELAKLDASEVT